MKKCHHHYQWYDGKLKCVRCGQRKWITRRTKRVISNSLIGVFLVVIGFSLYQYYGNDIMHYIQTEKPQETVIKTVSETIKNPINNSITNKITNTVTETATSLQPKPTNMTAIAFYIHNLINEQRSSHGLSSLSWNPTIAQAAINHSTDMAKRNYFEHDDPEGHDFSYRYSQVGFNCQITTGSTTNSYGYGGTQTTTYYSGGAENIMFLEGYYGEENIASQTVTGWMNSYGHRANILTSYFQSEGIGVAESDDGKIYATEDFC